MKQPDGSLKLAKYSLGTGDRFAHQAQAQLRACQLALDHGVEVVPVWNKSNREHLTIGSEPGATRASADSAVRALHWSGLYHVDADHIRLDTVDRFLPHSDFFTIDVADWIGKPAASSVTQAFAARHPELASRLDVPGVDEPFGLSSEELAAVARKYLAAVEEAGRIYRHISRAKVEGRFITEVSMDETDNPQTPSELLVILVALADEGIPIQTIAPKFSGRFNKGVDYAGDIAQFEREFCNDLAVLRFVVQHYSLPANLKLSVHSGSDKFSIYPAISRALARFDAGLHIKTAGTTWLEELIGLAESGSSGLGVAREVYAGALERLEELTAPYTAVIDIDRAKLPSAATVNSWSPEQFVAALRHDPLDPAYNPSLRQLLHVGYKIAAKMGQRFFDALETHRTVVARNVTENLYQRHIKPIFLDGKHSQPGMNTNKHEPPLAAIPST